MMSRENVGNVEKKNVKMGTKWEKLGCRKSGVELRVYLAYVQAKHKPRLLE